MAAVCSKLSISKFLDTLAAPTFSPGGGSAAALTAATACALVEMVSGLNVKRLLKKGEAAHSNAPAVKKIRERLLRLMTDDAAAFMGFTSVMKKPAESAVYQRALKKSAEIPLEICEFCAQALEFALAERDRTSRWLASDLDEATMLFETAHQSAKLNVLSNLSALSERFGRKELEARLESSEKEKVKLATAIRQGASK